MSDRATAVVEQVEAESNLLLQESAPDEVKALLGIETTRVGGGVVLSMRHDPTNYWSKALGFGEPLTADLVAEICDFYRAHGTPRAVLQLAPSVLPDDWAEICAKQHIKRSSTWVKLLHDGAPVEQPKTSLRVGRVDPEDATRWASTLLRAFGMPEEGFVPMFAAYAAQDGLTPYAAWDGDEMVAAATLFLHGEAAEFAGASTLPTHRGRGAQSALLASRVEDALAAGCRYLSAETGKPGPGEENSSLNNMLRVGFRHLHDRPNWAWTP